MANKAQPKAVTFEVSGEMSDLKEVIRQEIKEIQTKAEQPGSKMTTEEYARQVVLAVFRYRRPTKGILAQLNRFLGPLPQNAIIISPTKDRLSQVGSYWLFGLITAILTIVAIFGLATAFPFLSVSPWSLINDSVRYFTGEGIVGTALVVMISVSIFCFMLKFFTVGSVPTEGRAISKYAMVEEQWFRMGSENWTVRQRIQSCVLFGLVHIQNLIYPVTSLIVVGLLGGVLMAVYLRVYRKTKDYQKATLASTKLYAAHNCFSIAFVATALAAKGIIALIG